MPMIMAEQTSYPFSSLPYPMTNDFILFYLTLSGSWRISDFEISVNSNSSCDFIATL